MTSQWLAYTLAKVFTRETEQPGRHRGEIGEGHVSDRSMGSHNALQTCLQDDVHGGQGKILSLFDPTTTEWLIAMQKASNRAIDQQIRNKLKEATSLRGFPTSLLFS